MTDPSTAQQTMRATRQPLWQWLVEVLLIVAVFFVAAGDAPPHVNESHYLCRLKHYWDPAWCVGDLFLDSKDTQLLFIWLFGWITRLVSLTATAWIGRGIAWTLFAWSWQRLSWRVVPCPLASVLSAALLVALNTYAHMAGEWVVGGVEAKCFAYTLVVLAIREVIDGRWNLVWVLLGVATAFHPIVGGWSGVVCAGIWLIDARLEHRLLSMVPGLVAGGLVALVGILPALMLTWGVPAETVAEANRIYVFERLPHHLAPLTLPEAEVTRRLVGHAVLVGVLCVLCRASGGWGGAQRPSSALGARLWLDLSHPALAPLQIVTHFAFGAVVLSTLR